MPPKHSRPLSRTLSASSASSSSQPASSSRTTKLKQNKLDFSFHSTPFGARPLSSTPSFSLPTSTTANKGKQKQREDAQLQQRPSAPLNPVAEHTQHAKHADPLPDDGAFLWSERLAPHHSQELAVHPRKLAQVQTWIAEAFSEQPRLARNRKLLALTGPAGSAKSATIKALASAHDLDYDILEWHNDSPTFDPTAAFIPGSSFVDRFTDFLAKAAKFPTLHLQSAAEADSQEQSADTTASSSLDTLDAPAASARRNRLVLLQDLPNLHHPPTRNLFQAALEQHLAQSALLTARGLPNVPIVIIVTESTPREDQDGWIAGASGSTWRERIASIVDTRTVLGERIRRHPAYAEIRFNPVAPSIILKGLKRAIEHAPAHVLGSAAKGKAKGNALPRPIAELLQAVAEDSNGDLRAALNCLQFLGASRRQLDEMLKDAAAARSGPSKNRGVKRMLSLVAGRESSLALFHALGRVLYNKREGDPGDEASSSRAEADSDSDDPDEHLASRQRELRRAMQAIVASDTSESAADRELPAHLSHLQRRASRVDVDQLWADLPVDASLFGLYLHQNAPQFCGEVEEVEAVLEALSAADTMAPLHEQYRHSAVVAYYAFALATRGVLLGLPSPVPRQGQKFGKAAWWDVQKKLADLMRSVDDFRTLTNLARRPASYDEDGGARVRRTQFGNAALEVEGFDRSDAGLGDEALASVVSTSNAVTMVTEILPLLAKIRPGGMATELSRLRFDRAGVADMAAGTLDQHETGVEADATDEPGESAPDQHASKKIRLQEAHEDQVDVADSGELSDDQIADF